MSFRQELQGFVKFMNQVNGQRHFWQNCKPIFRQLYFINYIGLMMCLLVVAVND